AGLFFAALTAFVSETFPRLEKDPADETVALLQTIVQQLANGNELAGAFDDNAEFILECYVVRVNIFLFLSLAITLIAALLCLVGKQWLYEHHRHVTLPTKDILAVRYLRRESMEKWHVPTILAAIPICLQLGLILFFIGVIDLLWHTNHLVARLFSVVAAVGFVFLVATCVLPAITHLYYPDALPCAYKSGQAWFI
ncbi:hypothetical protein BDZ89DRAFT_902083, partial [Hymenopellis radicata]